MTARHDPLNDTESSEVDTLYRRLRSLERCGGSQQEFCLLIEDFMEAEPAVKHAMPQFSTFALLEALRKCRPCCASVEAGAYSASPEEAIRLMRHLSEGDVSLRHPWYSPNHTHFNQIVALLGGLFFAIAAPGGFIVAVVVGLIGALLCFMIASMVRFFVRNSHRRQERPQWICALHVDRYLHAYYRDEPLVNLRIDDLPNPGFRRKGPFYDLHNQIVSRPNWSYRMRARGESTLRFPNRHTAADAE